MSCYLECPADYTLDGTPGGDGVYVTRGAVAYLKNITVDNFSTGMVLNYSSNISLEGTNTFENNLYDGLQLGYAASLAGGSGLTTTNNERYGVNSEGNSASYLASLNASNNGESGVYIQGNGILT